MMNTIARLLALLTLLTWGPWLLADTNPPVLEAVSISPSSGETNLEYNVTVTVAFSDVDGMGNTQLRFTSQATGFNKVAGISAAQYTVDGVTGWYVADVAFNFAAVDTADTWDFSVLQVRDSLDNIGAYSHAAIEGAGFDSTFEITGGGSPPDTDGPVLTDLLIAPSIFDVTTQTRDIVIDLKLTDATDIDYLSMSFVNSTTSTSKVVVFSAVDFSFNASSQKFEASSTLTFDNQDPGGVWNVSITSARDSLGNEDTYSSGDIAGLGGTSSINITNNASTDTEGPVLVGFEFVPATIDVTAAPQSTSLNLSFTDDSLLERASIELLSAEDGAIKNIQIEAVDFTYNVGADQYEANEAIEFSNADSGGNWSVNQLIVRDQENNLRTYTGIDIVNLGFSNVLNVTNNIAPDTAAPEIVELRIVEEPLILSGRRSLNVTMVLRDQTGIGPMQFGFDSVNNAFIKTTTKNAQDFTYDPLNDTYSTTTQFFFDADDIADVWTFNITDIEDSLGNASSIDFSTILPLGSNSYLRTYATQPTAFDSSVTFKNSTFATNGAHQFTLALDANTPYQLAMYSYAGATISSISFSSSATISNFCSSAATAVSCTISANQEADVELTINTLQPGAYEFVLVVNLEPDDLTLEYNWNNNVIRYPALDFDGDGLYNDVDDDDDGDGLTDDFEIANGLNPFADDAVLDPDNDGLNSLDEFNLGTDPNNPDTDGDGMPDGYEVDNNLNPLVNDAQGDPDNDGLVNIDEYTIGTDPQNPDTDGDGFNDGDEVENGTDPLTKDCPRFVCKSSKIWLYKKILDDRNNP